VVAGLESDMYLSAERNSAMTGRRMGSGTSNNSVSHGVQAWGGSGRAAVKDDGVHRCAPAICKAKTRRGPPEKGLRSHKLLRNLHSNR